MMQTLLPLPTAFANDIDFLEETLENICWSGLRLILDPNKQEVVMVPKKSIKPRTIKGNPILKDVFKLSRFGFRICIIIIFP